MSPLLVKQPSPNQMSLLSVPGTAPEVKNGWHISDRSNYAISQLRENSRLPRTGHGLPDSGQIQPNNPYLRVDTTNRHIQPGIDITPPLVIWNSPLNTEVTDSISGISAEITDRDSGVCLVQISSDNGRSWENGWDAQDFILNEVVKETTWTYHPGFPEFTRGAHIVILRAQDCDGNTSPGEILVVIKR